MKNILLLFLTFLFIISCLEDTEEKNEKKAQKLIKTISVSKPDDPRLYTYNNAGQIESVTNKLHSFQNYRYDKNGDLILDGETIGSVTFSYSFDKKGRIIKQTKKKSQEYLELIFKDSIRKVEVNKHSGLNNHFEIISKFELTLDSKGRIIKIENFGTINKNLVEQKETIRKPKRFDYKIIEYDARGNMIKNEAILNRKTRKIERIKYDNKVNPYYAIHKDYNSLKYYVNNYNGILYNAYNSVLSPNNRIEEQIEFESQEGKFKVNTEYIYNEEGYPIYKKRTNNNKDNVPNEVLYIYE